MSSQIQLVEYSSLKGVRLTREEASALNDLGVASQREGSPTRKRVLQVGPEYREGAYTLTASSVVGSVKLGDTQISIVPKIGVGKTAFMLGYSLDEIRWRDEDLWQSSGDLLEALVVPFVESVEALVAGGLEEAYSEVEEVGSRPRGAIDFSWSGVGLPLPVRYRFDSFDVDTAANRVLRAALLQILSVAGMSRLGGVHAMQLLDAFHGVPRLAPLDLDPFISSDRYKAPLDLARMILDGSGIEPAKGETFSRSLLFDMNSIFENFVVRVIAEHLEGAGFSVDSQGRRFPRFLVDRRRLMVHPDFAIWSGGRCLLVGDVKYKLLNGSLRRTDLYQAISYALATGAETALLLYAGSGPDVQLTIPSTGTRVHAVPVSIDALSGREIAEVVVDAVRKDLAALD